MRILKHTTNPTKRSQQSIARNFAVNAVGLTGILYGATTARDEIRLHTAVSLLFSGSPAVIGNPVDR